jgi:hypothetical protein
MLQVTPCLESIMTGAAVVFATTLLTSTATAGKMPLESLNRFHAGLSITDSGSGVGGIMGLDSRMTRLIFVDIGGFYTPGDQQFDTTIERDTAEPTDWYTLRNGLYAAPGIRIPHRYQDGFNWDVVGRVGFAAVWIADESQHIIPDANALVYSEAAMLSGVDVLLRYDTFGVRMSGKAFAWKKYSPIARIETVSVRPQFTIEGVVQF